MNSTLRTPEALDPFRHRLAVEAIAHADDARGLRAFRQLQRLEREATVPATSPPPRLQARARAPRRSRTAAGRAAPAADDDPSAGLELIEAFYAGFRVYQARLGGAGGAL